MGTELETRVKSLYCAIKTDTFRIVGPREASYPFQLFMVALLHRRTDSFVLATEGVSKSVVDSTDNILSTCRTNEAFAGARCAAQYNESLSAVLGAGSYAVVAKQNAKGGQYITVCYDCIRGNAAHILGCLPRLFPALFQGKLAPTQDELTLLKGFYSGSLSSVPCRCAIKNILDTLHIEDNLVEKAVAAITSGAYEAKMNSLCETLHYLNQRIEETRQTISDYLKNIDQTNARIAWLYNHKQDTVQKEMVDFIRSNEIEIENSSADGMRFVVHTTLCTYDETLVPNYLLNSDRVTDCIYSRYPPEQVREFLKQLLLDRRFQLKLKAKYTLNADCYASAELASDIYDDYICNPHISQYACLGGYARDLGEAQRQHDYVASLAICQQSAGSVNPAEPMQYIRLLEDLADSKGNVIRTPQGDITFKECMQRIAQKLEEPQS